jgi:hypothetical protein
MPGLGFFPGIFFDDGLVVSPPCITLYIGRRLLAPLLFQERQAEVIKCGSYFFILNISHGWRGLVARVHHCLPARATSSRQRGN